MREVEGTTGDSMSTGTSTGSLQKLQLTADLFWRSAAAQSLYYVCSSSRRSCVTAETGRATAQLPQVACSSAQQTSACHHSLNSRQEQTHRPEWCYGDILGISTEDRFRVRLSVPSNCSAMRLIVVGVSTEGVPEELAACAATSIVVVPLQ